MLSQATLWRASPVVLVCRTDKRSEKAATILRSRGIRDVRVLRGGMENWASAAPGPRRFSFLDLPQSRGP